MIIFINGKIGLLSPPGGKEFWKCLNGSKWSFVEGARHFFNDHDTYFSDIDFCSLSGVKKRWKEGYSFGCQKFSNEFPKGEYLHFVAHSMGCAFTEGLIKVLNDYGFSIGKVVYINCFQAKKLRLGNDNREFTVDYQMLDDPLINNVFLRGLGIARPGKVRGADYQLYERSGISNFFKKHRGPMGILGNEFWERLDSRIYR